MIQATRTIQQQFDAIVAALRTRSRAAGVQFPRIRSEQCIACCPAHDDKDPSLSVSIGRNGDPCILMRCHAGCTTEAILHALGLDWQALYADRDEPRAPLRAPDAVDLEAEHDRCTKALNHHRLAALASELGVSPESLVNVGAGWSERHDCYTFPYRDANGTVVGISTRFQNGTKKSYAGGHHGFVQQVAPLPEWGGTILLVEGASDTAACLDMGLYAIGRASNHVSDDARQWLEELVRHRHVIVVAENDQKGENWPGKEAAIATAEWLSVALRQPVAWSIMDEAKDTRDWLNQNGRDAGHLFIQELERNAVTIGAHYPKQLHTSADCHRSTVEWIERRERSGPSIKSGYPALDELSGGFAPQELIILAARTGMGKTMSSENFVGNQSGMTILEPGDVFRPKHRVGFFSSEMQREVVWSNMVCRSIGMDTRKPVYLTFDAAERNLFIAASKQASAATLMMDDKPGIRLDRFIGNARAMARDWGAEIIYMDYIQLMKEPESERQMQHQNERIGRMSKACKQIARELDIPVVILAQVNRGAEKQRGDCKPVLSDLKGSGDLEEDADKIIFVHRPYYYTRNEEDLHKGLFILAKNRHGPIGEVEVEVELPTHRIMPIQKYANAAADLDALKNDDFYRQHYNADRTHEPAHQDDYDSQPPI